jgi:predicted metal-dependent HD superfamily phosphohydrolase
MSHRPPIHPDLHRESPAHVWASLDAAAHGAFGSQWQPAAIRHVYHTVVDLFKGQHPAYQAIDAAYHNLTHTLQVVRCFSDLFLAYHRNAGHSTLTADDYATGLAAALFHDTGYLKLKGDAQGTGAKFTRVHEARSATLAADMLAAFGWDTARIDQVRSIIESTGPHANFATIHYPDNHCRLLGQMLCTVDYVAQISDPLYAEKLPQLFAEFAEADGVDQLTAEQRTYPTLDHLISQTPRFWRQAVLPRLENDCNGLYHYLREPWPDGPNPYLVQAEQNIARIAAKSFAH